MSENLNILKEKYAELLTNSALPSWYVDLAKTKLKKDVTISDWNTLTHMLRLAILNGEVSSKTLESLLPYLENLEQTINTKVDKESGKGLSSNDYTNEEKAKVSKSVAEDDLKTINGESIVGSGNIEIKGGSGNVIDLTSLELTLGETYHFPNGITYVDFENATAVSIFAETGTMILPKVAAVSYEGSNAIMFSINTPTVSYSIIVDKESNQFTFSETTGFNVSEFFYWDDNHNIQVRGTTNEGDYTYHLQNLRIKLNGINHDTFTEDGANRELDLDTAINNVVEIAEGKTNSYVLKWFNNPFFESNEDVIRINLKDNPILDSSGAAVPNTALKIGDIFYIIETNVPDRWLAGIDRDVYVFAKMETSKVNLGEYYNKTETDALLPKTIDLGLVEDGNYYPLPEGKTIEDFINADAVIITTPILYQENTLNVKVTLYKSGNVQGMGALFSTVGMSKYFELSVLSEGYSLYVHDQPTTWWVEQATSYQDRIFFRAYQGGKCYEYKVYGNKIKLNGTTYNPFSDTEPETLDIDTVIDNKITAAINNRLNTELAKINKAIEEDY